MRKKNKKNKKNPENYPLTLKSTVQKPGGESEAEGGGQSRGAET